MADPIKIPPIGISPRPAYSIGINNLPAFQNNGYVPNFPNFNPQNPASFVAPTEMPTTAAQGLMTGDEAVFGQNFNTPVPPINPATNTVDWRWLGKDGVLVPGLNALSNLSNAITGYQQLGLAKEAFDFNKRLTETNLANQARTTNADIIARERSQLRQRGGNQIPNLDQLARTRSQDRLVKGTL